jgi:hypothetical protein
MSRLALALLVVVVLLAGALYWLTLTSSGPRQASPANSVVSGAEPQPMPQTSAAPGDKPEAENSFIVCPGNPRCP